ncbi:S8 family peptidase [Natronobacterium texcoconense]|uniref:Serine protease, subtilisin family n=1 Tax=Natronobacterium texcoconense TaxID=1095778 RepID=A0A1H1HQQ2_NATTX|nr:S8 family serine peptidase [Natronobacterium texcoconense]SDR27448.1 Serine protease, subtilisin family [Natronobacterium texcoconense]
MRHDTTSRRSVLKTIGAAGVGIACVGTVSGADRDRYLVTGDNDRNRLETSEFTVHTEFSDANVYLVEGPEGSSEELRSIDGVQGVTPDLSYSVDVPDLGPADDESGSEADQWDNELVDSFAANEYATGEGTQVGIIDTGVAYGHPDLGNLNTDLSRAFVDGEELDDADDVHYHGTHVAGIAGATGEEYVAGIAPETELVSLRVFPSEGPLLASVSDTFLALEYAAENGLDVVNMSIGSPPYPAWENADAARDGFRVAREQMLRSVVQRGTTVVVAAGNEATNIQRGNECRTVENEDGEEEEVCARWFQLWGSLQHSISVSATTAEDELASFSNYGVPHVDVGAPGANVLSTLDPDNEALPGAEYANLSGTSMASPQVAGLTALVAELAPDQHPNQDERAIKHGADLVEGESDPEFGAGRINALETVERLR